MSSESGRPLITNIHRLALDDGPGIRTTVFFKGCRLSCRWCHNPEAISPECEIAFHRHLCIACGDCFEVCPTGAIRMDWGQRIDRDACIVCGTCTDACPTGALKVVGRYFTVPELTEELFKDHHFYEVSKGGVTFSGGEPAIFMDYVAAVAKNLKKRGINTAMQTSGYFDFAEFMSKLYLYIDLVYFDIKLFDPRQHRQWTGKDNRGILKNLRQLASLPGVAVVPRIPLIPGITDTEDNLLNTGDFLRKTGYKDFDMLPYNSGGVTKRITLGKDVSDVPANLTFDGLAEKRARNVFLKTFSAVRRRAGEIESAPALLNENR